MSKSAKTCTEWKIFIISLFSLLFFLVSAGGFNRKTRHVLFFLLLFLWLLFLHFRDWWWDASCENVCVPNKHFSSIRSDGKRSALWRMIFGFWRRKMMSCMCLCERRCSKRSANVWWRNWCVSQTKCTECEGRRRRGEQKHASTVWETHRDRWRKHTLY